MKATEIERGLFEIKSFWDGELEASIQLTDNQVRNLAKLAGFIPE